MTGATTSVTGTSVVSSAGGTLSAVDDASEAGRGAASDAKAALSPVAAAKGSSMMGRKHEINLQRYNAKAKEKRRREKGNSGILSLSGL
jgi:hypothetical protein